ncbi:uncharacterized protein [Linepithema humile]|uniref:uncharacterized protein n=1 Tax=Linepithema humile TaxID=83485 RepID=UPI00351E2C50
MPRPVRRRLAKDPLQVGQHTARKKREKAVERIEELYRKVSERIINPHHVTDRTTDRYHKHVVMIKNKVVQYETVQQILDDLKTTDVSNQENQQPNIARNLETFSWNDANTKLFLSLYKEMKELVAYRKIKSFKEMWKRITDEMKNSGYDVTATQVENKWKTLERQYKKVISNNNQTGKGRITCSYQAELTEILSKCHKIVPLAVTGSELGVMVRNNVSDSGTSINNRFVF